MQNVLYVKFFDVQLSNVDCLNHANVKLFDVRYSNGQCDLNVKLFDVGHSNAEHHNYTNVDRQIV